MLTIFQRPGRFPLVHAIDETSAISAAKAEIARRIDVAGQFPDAQLAQGWRVQLDRPLESAGPVGFLFGPWAYVRDRREMPWAPAGQRGLSVAGTFDPGTGALTLEPPSQQAAEWWNDAARQALESILREAQRTPTA